MTGEYPAVESILKGENTESRDVRQGRLGA